MDVVSALVVNLQPPEAIQPRKRPFYHPPVSPQLLAGFDAPQRDTRGYAPLPECFAASRGVVALGKACSFFGRLRGRPRRGLRIGEIASTTSSKTFESWTLAAE
jgi:hypothetical protein